MQLEMESKLVARLRNGEATALEALMERYASRVYRLAYRITRDEADAEEVAQDVFLILCRKVHTFEGRAALGSWIYRVTTNAALNKRRGKRSAEGEDHAMGLADASPMADASPTPEEELLSLETRIILSRLIGDLPDRYRTALVLRDVEGLSNGEAAEALGTSLASMKSRVHRARSWLRQHLRANSVSLRIQTAGCGRTGG